MEEREQNKKIEEKREKRNRRTRKVITNEIYNRENSNTKRVLNEDVSRCLIYSITGGGAI